MRAGITGEFGVPREYDDERRAINLCAERGISVSNTYFQQKDLYKSFSGTTPKNGVEVMSMIHLVLGIKAILRYVQNVRVVRGMTQGLSDHHVVLCKVKLVDT